jgi:hypothetical protein
MQAVRQHVTSVIAGHRTLCVGILYAAAIATVLAVTRLF